MASARLAIQDTIKTRLEGTTGVENVYVDYRRSEHVVSFVSLYYYLMVIKEMYISEPEEPGRLQVPVLLSGLAVALVAGVFYVGIYPRHLFEVAEEATKLLFA
ncbi:MAG: hypothetical protein IIB19_00790 [Chloroflexi bacterium]|nr:hypothetical protein [Chloroflexota bacterium]